MSRSLNNWIDAYLSYTKRGEPDQLLNEWIAVSLISAVLERKVWVDKATETWYPNLYVIIGGDAGVTRKGTAMGFGRKILHKSNVDVMVTESKGSTSAFIKTLTESTKAFFIGDKQYLHSPVVVWASEFANFIKKEPDNQIYDLLNDAFDCLPDFKYNTRQHGAEKVEFPIITLVGAITPELFVENIPSIAIGGGFSSRLIIVVGPPAKFSASAELDRTLGGRLAEDLHHIHTLTGPFKRHESFDSKYDPWYESMERPPHLNNRFFSSYISRRQVHLTKLSMIMAISEGDDLVLRDRHWTRAMDLLVRTERQMPKMFDGFGRAKNSGLIKDIITHIHNNSPILRSALIDQFLGDVGSYKELDNHLAMLRQIQAIKIHVSNEGQVITYVPKSERRNGTH